MFKSVQKFKDYQVNQSIKFWHWADKEWKIGKIVDIRQAQNYLVSVCIQYRSRSNKILEMNIFREDWLKLPQ